MYYAFRFWVPLFLYLANGMWNGKKHIALKKLGMATMVSQMSDIEEGVSFLKTLFDEELISEQEHTKYKVSLIDNL